MCTSGANKKGLASTNSSLFERALAQQKLDNRIGEPTFKLQRELNAAGYPRTVGKKDNTEINPMTISPLYRRNYNPEAREQLVRDNKDTMSPRQIANALAIARAYDHTDAHYNRLKNILIPKEGKA
jgi:hypothetical protein